MGLESDEGAQTSEAVDRRRAPDPHNGAGWPFSDHHASQGRSPTRFWLEHHSKVDAANGSCGNLRPTYAACALQ
jgi:hypothetical protein